MEISKEQFERVRADAETRYKCIGSLYCPYLDDNVHFNAEGFEHLLFKNRHRPRRTAEQFTRLRLLPLAEETIKKSHTLQEYDRQVAIVRLQSAGRWNKSPKWVHYYVFIALVRPRIRIKVVVREIEGGKKQFYSLFPSWKVEKAVDGSKRKTFYSEDPAEL